MIRLPAFLIVALLVLLVPARAYTIEEIARADLLLRLLDERLQISQQVAQAKWNSGGPIEDLVREKQVLEAFVQSAQEAGAAPRLAAAFMQAQIEASKMRQRTLFRLWRARRQPAFAHPPDLVTQVRPRLDELSRRMLTALISASPLDRDLLAWRAEVLWGFSRDPARQQALQGWP